MATIHIDASRALAPEPTGVNVYAFEIIDHLVRIVPESDKIILYAYGDSRDAAAKIFPNLPKNCEWKFLNWPPRFLWTQLRLAYAWACADTHDAVFFAPAHVAPFFSPRNTVVTIHDVAYDLLPDAYSFFERWFAHKMTLRMVARSRAILVPSNETRTQLIARYSAALEKITVIPLALPCALKKNSENILERISEKNSATEMLARYKITQPYILFVGRIEYKKGIDFLLEAFALLPANAEVQLVLVGKPGVGYEKIASAITSTPSIRALGFVPAFDVRVLYAHASAYALPSRYEGFGMNILEAFEYRCPLVATRAGSIPEVAGGAALYADTPAEFADALGRVLTDTVLAEKMKDAGSERIKEFGWDKNVKELLTIFYRGLTV